MSSLAEKDLEEQLVEFGNKLQKPPEELEELLPLLEALESCLGRVEQSPSKSMTAALCPSMKSLVSPVLLRHVNEDVKVSVATCLCEITRITAPDAPYDDDLMKEIFKLTVEAFKDLSDATAPSFAKRVLILETVAKVRSCVVMLDLECDDLIVEMFRHFFASVREDHAECIFASMEGIMTVVVEESEDIPFELLSVLLDNLKIDNKDVSPVARRLVEKVMRNCTAKLKPYLVEAVKSQGILVKEYSKIVGEIIREALEKRSNLGTFGKDLKAGKLDQVNVSSKTAKDEDKSGKVRLSNGSLSSPKVNSSRVVQSKGRKAKQSTTGKCTSSSEFTPTTVDQKSGKVEGESNQATKRTKGCKPNALKKATWGSGDAQTMEEDGDDTQPKSKRGRKRKGGTLQVDGQSVQAVHLKSESKKEVISERARMRSANKAHNLASDGEQEPSSPLMVNKTGKGKKGMKIEEAKSSHRLSEKAQDTKDSKSTPTLKRLGRKFKGSDDKIDHRKAGDSGEKTHGSRNHVKAYDENLVGARIKVYWPLDKAFYEGSVVSYNPDTKKHKISYADGDEEELMLSKERWEYVEQAGHSRSGNVDCSTAVTPPKKRIKALHSAMSNEKEVKEEPALQKRKETSSDKSKSVTPKANAKIQSNGSSVKKSSLAKTPRKKESNGRKRLHGSMG